MKQFKLFIATLLANCVGLVTINAQNSLVATLSHNGELTAFYGLTAFQEAHEAATHGDIITLSGGTFNTTEITKAISLRGAGMKVDKLAQTESTIIPNGITINIPDSIEGMITIEGIDFHQSLGGIKNKGKLNNPRFIKCYCYSVSSGIMKDAVFSNCIISDYFSLAANSSANILNSIIYDPGSADQNTSNYVLTNCLIGHASTNGKIYRSSITNCIFDGGYPFVLDSSNTVYNNVICDSTSTIFSNMPNSNNYYLDYVDVFRSYSGKNIRFDLDMDLELTDTFKTTYKGTDETELGIFGGAIPYDPRVNKPIITKCVVSSKATEDDKINVDITVDGVE